MELGKDLVESWRFPGKANATNKMLKYNSAAISKYT